jgi:hypothetical protein
MFLGHYGVAFAAKKLAPRTCLGWFLAATAAIDLLWPVFLLLGLEHVRIAPGITVLTPLDFYDYPITHSLVGAIGWSIVFAALYFAFNRDQRGALVVGVLVTSHWVLDAVVHRPDLPLYPGGPLIGFGLWNSLPGTLIVEGVLWIGGVWVYLETTKAKSVAGHYALWSFIIFFSSIYVATAFGPPPPNVQTIAVMGLAQFLIIPWGWWIDAKREVRGER